MTDALFYLPDPDPGARDQACIYCPARARGSDDKLRLNGWIAFDGRSITGKALHVRICPACQKEKK